MAKYNVMGSVSLEEISTDIMQPFRTILSLMANNPLTTLALFCVFIGFAVYHLGNNTEEKMLKYFSVVKYVVVFVTLYNILKYVNLPLYLLINAGMVRFSTLIKTFFKPDSKVIEGSEVAGKVLSWNPALLVSISLVPTFVLLLRLHSMNNTRDMIGY